MKQSWQKIILSLLITLSILVIAACQSQPSSGEEDQGVTGGNGSTQQSPGLDIESSYPVPQQDINNSYPAPQPTTSDRSYPPPATTGPRPTEVKPTQDLALGMVTGLAYSKVLEKPLVETITRLAKVYRDGDQGAYVLDEAFSPLAWTDEDGIFTFFNVEPGEYVLVVGDIYDKYEVIQENSGLPITYQVKAGETMNLDRVEVNLP